MSAHEQMRAMLDQLMGTGRDGENNKFKVHFTDPRVCKSFLLACCPHDILAATRMDLGECPKLHDLALRADYENASQKKDYFYDVDAMEHLQNFINECDRRTEQAKKRLADTQEELSAEVAAKLNKVHDLAEQIGKKLAEAERLGAEGNVEESMKTLEEVEEFRKQKAVAEQEYRNSMPASSYQQQKLRVCEVCSAYLGIHDNDRRLADHFGGKLHLGFITIREKLEELKLSLAEESISFKAQPATVLHRAPFIPEKSNKQNIGFQEFELHTDRRASERLKLKEQKIAEEEEKEKILLAQKLVEEENEQKEILKLRQELVHKANPIRQFKPVEIKPSSIPLTEPKSPDFETDKRLRSRHEK